MKLIRKFTVPFTETGDEVPVVEVRDAGGKVTGTKPAEGLIAGRLVFGLRRPKGRDRQEIANRYARAESSELNAGDIDREIFLRFADRCEGINELLRAQGYDGDPVPEEVSEATYDEYLDSWVLDAVIDEISEAVLRTKNRAGE